MNPGKVLEEFNSRKKVKFSIKYFGTNNIYLLKNGKRLTHLKYQLRDDHRTYIYHIIFVNTVKFDQFIHLKIYHLHTSHLLQPSFLSTKIGSN